MVITIPGSEMGLERGLDLCQPQADRQHHPARGDTAQLRHGAGRGSHLLVARGRGGGRLPAGNGGHHRTGHWQLYVFAAWRAGRYCQRHGTTPHCERAAGTGYQWAAQLGLYTLGYTEYIANNC